MFDQTFQTEHGMQEILAAMQEPGAKPHKHPIQVYRVENIMNQSSCHFFLA